MHKALYREYRPLTFENIIGQNHIIRTLKNQIKEDSLSHAYLFCGTRGTGKTSTAKILSRAVNCLDESENKPCNKCECCKTILDNTNLDVIEIDAASNNSVDDIRELRETVKYSPSTSKYKVYIIDEVHMLSQGAFNALLKTLEEPPSHVIFILATTEPNKIPATILSRCQRFDFRRVSLNDLVVNLKSICDKKDVKVENNALKIIAQNGQGSVRDSLSILDQCISFTKDELTAKDVLDLIGAIDINQLASLSKAIITQNSKETLKHIDEYFTQGKDIKILVNDLISYFRNIMLFKVSKQSEDIQVLTEDVLKSIEENSELVQLDNLINILEVMSNLQANIKNSQNQRITMEIFAMKLTTPAFDKTDSGLLKRIEELEKIIEKINLEFDSEVYQNLKAGKIMTVKQAENKDESLDESLNDEKIESKPNQNTVKGFDIIDDEEIDQINEKWDDFLCYLKNQKNAPMAALYKMKSAIKYKNNIMYVIFEDNILFAKEKLSSEKMFDIGVSAMKQVFGLDIDLRFAIKSELENMNFGEISKNIDMGEVFLKHNFSEVDIEIKDK